MITGIYYFCVWKDSFYTHGAIKPAMSFLLMMPVSRHLFDKVSYLAVYIGKGDECLL